MPETNDIPEGEHWKEMLGQKEEAQILVCAKLISESSNKAKAMRIPAKVYIKTSMIFLASGLHALFKDEWREKLEEVIEEHMDEIERMGNARN
jgi:hypothetical protein